MKILSLLLAETPGTNPMYIRPYNVEWREGYIDSLRESTCDGRNLAPGAIANVANSMLRPTAVSKMQAQIANGFGTDRMTVTMVVQVEDNNGRVVHELLTGYTDHVGVHDALGRAVYDEEMRFFFNGVANLTYQSGFGANGYGSYQFTNATQLLTPLQGWDVQDQVPVAIPTMTTMRPKDVLAGMNTGAFLGVPGIDSKHQFATPVLANTTYQFSGRAKRSLRTNNMASEYLSRVLTGYRDSMLSPEVDARTGASALQLASEAKYINEPLTASSAILTALGRRTSYGQEWSVSWRELLSLDPSLINRVQPIKMDPAYRDTANAIVSGSANWNGGKHEQQVAQLVSGVLPASMVRFALGRIHFIAHSETLDGSVVVDIHNLHGAAPEIDPRPLLGMIKQHLTYEVFPQLNNNGAINLYVEADIMLNGLSTIKVNVNHGGVTPFVAPTYCDALYAPTLAPTMDGLNGLCHSLGQAAAELTANSMLSGPGVIPTPGERQTPISYATPSVVSPIGVAPQQSAPVAPGAAAPMGKPGLGF